MWHTATLNVYYIIRTKTEFKEEVEEFDIQIRKKYLKS